jgi:hypothetical protein
MMRLVDLLHLSVVIHCHVCHHALQWSFLRPNCLTWMMHSLRAMLNSSSSAFLSPTCVFPYVILPSNTLLRSFARETWRQSVVLHVRGDTLIQLACQGLIHQSDAVIGQSVMMGTLFGSRNPLLTGVVLASS